MNETRRNPLNLSFNSSETDLGRFLDGSAFISTMQTSIDVDDFSSMFEYYKKSGENHLPIYTSIISRLTNISIEVYQKGVTLESLNRAKYSLADKIFSIKKSLPESRINEFLELLDDVIDSEIGSLNIKPEKTRRSVYKEKKTYLMTDSNTGFTKIGRSVKPKFRESTLQSEKPTITLLATCEIDCEEELHEKYKTKRGRGEWFNLSSDDIESIINDYNFNLIES